MAVDGPGHPVVVDGDAGSPRIALDHDDRLGERRRGPAGACRPPRRPTAHTPRRWCAWWRRPPRTPGRRSPPRRPRRRGPRYGGADRPRPPRRRRPASPRRRSDTTVPLPPGRGCARTRDPRLTSMPRLLNERTTARTTSSSHPLRMVGSASNTVTAVPRSANIEANSQPMAPPPMTATARGSSSRARTSSDVITTVPSTSNPGIVRGTDPAASTTSVPGHLDGGRRRSRRPAPGGRRAACRSR